MRNNVENSRWTSAVLFFETAYKYGRPFLFFSVAVIVYALTAVMSCRASVRRFDAVDL